jgi:ABC-2 type transport system ATP-binding protein/lipopolysaccharide transport system ATP-binding protein
VAPRSDGELSIQVQSVGVRFDLPEDRIRSFKEYLLRRLTRRVSRREFWALRSVDLEVERGETLGIIGSNGAGKSTLLKVICRVLRPTLGRIVVRGRVAPLLELGAGFHPDMSGRENIRINATILGYGRKRIAERTDDVIEFSELRDQIESPVRNYSRGMVARLGFAVATLCRPDILVLDEVLAVGDEQFRAKCLERLRTFRAQGTTTLLVSHALGTVRESCDRAAWIDQGRLVRVGPSAEVVAAYQEFVARDRASA